MMSSWNIQIEYRKPRGSAEKKIYGRTYIHPNKAIATIFINSERTRHGEALNTFFHEITHVWNLMVEDSKPSPRTREEFTASVIGDTVEAVLRSLKRG